MPKIVYTTEEALTTLAQVNISVSSRPRTNNDYEEEDDEYENNDSERRSTNTRNIPNR